MSAVKSVIVGGCGLLLLAGCGGGTKASTTTTPAPAVTQSPSTAAAKSGSALAAAEAMKSYADAQGRMDDPDLMREALKLTAPNSVAYAYLDHQANMAEASLDGGQQLTKAELTPGGDGSFTACEPTDATKCVTFGDFKLNAAGKLVNLTVNKQQIGPRIAAGKGKAVVVGATKFIFLTAYKSIQPDALYVTLRIETGINAISDAISVATYRGPDGKSRKATDFVGLDLIDANSNTIVAMTFASVKPGGKIILQGCAPQDCTSTYIANIGVG